MKVFLKLRPLTLLVGKELLVVTGRGYTPIDQVSGYYVVSSYQMYWGSDGGGTGQAVTSEYATGTWSLVPDAGSSFELLAAALAALGAGRLAFGGWKNHGKS